MADNPGRKCPKCGMNLGQKNLCPICDKPAHNNENAASTASQGGDYVSSVIEFVENHLYDWDDVFNKFYDGLSGVHDFEECYEACSKVRELFIKNLPNSEKISGSKTINVMRELRSVFPDLTNEEARVHAVRLLEKCASTPAPPPPGSDPEFMDLYHRAMEQNNAEAQYLLGCGYRNGEWSIPKQNYKEAVKWFRKAAKQGYAWAQHDLGNCYWNGKGVNIDTAEAVKWYRKAAEQGDVGTQCFLGFRYLLGDGVVRDQAEAVKWLRKAAERGDKLAQGKLKELGQ